MEAEILELPLNPYHNIFVKGKYCITDMMINHKKYYDFALLHYTTMICLVKENNILYYDFEGINSFFEDDDIFSVETCKFPNEIADFNSVDIIEFMCELLRNGKYLYLFCDDYYNVSSDFFERNHTKNEYLLYGYRKKEGAFCAYGALDKNPICTSFSVNFIDIKRILRDTGLTFYIIEKEKYSVSPPKNEVILQFVKEYLTPNNITTNEKKGINATLTAIQHMRQVSEYQKITYLMRIIEFERLFSSRLFVLSEAQIIPSDLASTHYSILGEYITAVKKYKKEQGASEYEKMIGLIEKLVQFELSDLSKVFRTFTR